MFREISREAQIGRAMKSGNEAFDYRSRDELERAYAREDLRGEEAGSSIVSGYLGHKTYFYRLKLNVIVPITFTGIFVR